MRLNRELIPSPSAARPTRAGRRSRTAARRNRSATRMPLEVLEERCLLSFGPAVSYAVGVSPQAVAVGDFNGDGKADMVTANTDNNTVSVLLNNGDGSFGAAQDLAVGVAPTSVAVGDFNGDGKLDIVAANQGTYPSRRRSSRRASRPRPSR